MGRHRPRTVLRGSDADHPRRARGGPRKTRQDSLLVGLRRPATEVTLSRIGMWRGSSRAADLSRVVSDVRPDKTCWECARARGEDGCKAQIVGIDAVYSHVAASAARCRRDHCLLWTRLVTAAARRRLGEPAVPAKRGGNGWLLASRIGTNARYTTVQVRDGGSPTSAVHGLPQARLCV